MGRGVGAYRSSSEVEKKKTRRGREKRKNQPTTSIEGCFSLKNIELCPLPGTLQTLGKVDYVATRSTHFALF